jgi:hypothetical protein
MSDSLSDLGTLLAEEGLWVLVIGMCWIAIYRADKIIKQIFAGVERLIKLKKTRASKCWSD